MGSTCNVNIPICIHQAKKWPSHQIQNKIIRKTVPAKKGEINPLTSFVLWRERCNRVLRDTDRDQSLQVKDILLEWILSR
jgi:hypothetical protein